MDKKLLASFLSTIGENDLIYFLYRNQNGKNKWNIIRSAIDWISVSVDGIHSCTQSLNLNNSNEASLKMINLVIYVDILWEAIQQLHRVVFNTGAIPFKMEKTIFKKNKLVNSDNNYFKTIRACFAAHPVDLKDYFTSSKKEERRYASWSGQIGRSSDFSVILYSNIVGEEDIWFNLDIDELVQFAERNYNYLKTLQKELERQKIEYKNKYKAIEIRKSDSAEKQIDILIDESFKRFDNDCCKYRLDELKMIFSTSIQNPNNLILVEQYRNYRKDEINIIFKALQNMDLDILNESPYDDRHIPSSCHYPFSKLSDAVHGSSLPYWADIETFKSHIGDIAQLDEVSSLTELYIVVLASFYSKSRDIQNNI